ncbi:MULTISPECIES: flagellar basal body rod protein FlgC [Pseudoalteromonas]|uniref:Flagellar basal-body rod protein FlgC n=1 Tax=Pseudoalteromonas haloplanktis TaxID=228 RepID=A0ABU1BIJ9_PSEHA|nr:MULTISPECIES: flagellar basal body rod protein FlgC [Pseudoalteromonas]MCF6145501.1 flagellar basal-body rod protein FlgC [Pseudoalteromonas mariniglutinosa NCIMB 1770]MDQ9094082.1 flagellar basal body rod protein FlgC [Pseudoalteromonas haloplanktis]TMN73727.1 flagellar basal body rod protein FlgC [Pseudoalteromonas sp. S1727]BDF95040.1 flagellar basal-body rod protein FlgC [Pseudoalteromonas sp. KAN5]
MSLYNVFDISGTGMSAQNVRLNTTASNISNANTISSSQDKTYRARHPVFAAELMKASESTGNNNQGSSVGVKVLGIVESDKPLQIEYNPNHPSADENGYIYKPNVNVVEEMANMISASRSYQTNVQVADAAKQMLSKTLLLGQR